MDDIELDNINKGREEERSGQDREREETSFTERTEETKDDYDNIRSRLSPDSIDEGETNEGLEYDDEYDLSERLQNQAQATKEQMIRREAIKALEAGTGVRFNVEYGENTKTLIDHISDIKFRKKDGVLIKLKYKGEKVVLTKEGKIDKRSTHKNKKIWEAIAAANEEYEKTFDAVADEGVGFFLSDEAVESVRESVADSLEDLVWNKYNEISQNDLDNNVEREIRGIPYVDKYVDYDNLEDPNQKILCNFKIASLKEDIKHWKDLEEKEQDPTKKLLYKTAKELCIAKKSYMEVRANQRPESEEALSMIQEEAEKNDLTRFERFKKWAKENITGVSAIAISVAGIITATVMAGRNAVKKGAKAVGQFGKALANLAKKAGPAIATILNVLAQVLTWGAKALEFLSRNLWIVALFLTYLVYDTVKGRMKSKN